MERSAVYDVIVVGGGPGGMAAAVAARQAGLDRVLLLERGGAPGGVLPQCIHDGFGQTPDGAFRTGPEYAALWRRKVEESGVSLRSDTTALRIEGEGPYRLWVAGVECGYAALETRSLVLATGCREKTLGQLRVPGSRPAGIYPAGAAQYMMNCGNYLPGRSAVILGSGDIGLIMARRLTLEGARVRMVLGQYASGLIRNYVQCVRDFHIPLRFGYTVTGIHGYQRLKGITIAPLDGDRPDRTRRQYVPCDTLLVAAGLIPETELWKTVDRTLDGAGGIPANGRGETPRPGIFACGNVVRICDSVEEVTAMGLAAGRAAAEWVRGEPCAPAGREESAGPIHALGRKITREDVEILLRGPEEETVFCIQCPRGCRIRVEGETCSGAGCRAGAEYAKRERTAPVRVVTTTVALTGGRLPLLSVRTDRPVDRARVTQVVRACKRLTAAAPVRMGQVLRRNIAGTGADLVACADAEERV